MAWSWYGVKTLYRCRASGKAAAPDRHYDPKATLVEERVVLVRARSFDDALRKGEVEARAYAAGPAYLNPYGQRVRLRYLSAVDAFQLFVPPGNGAEVFSSTTIVSDGVSDRRVLDLHLGASSTHRARRTKFLNAAFSSKNWWRSG